MFRCRLPGEADFERRRSYTTKHMARGRDVGKGKQIKHPVYFLNNTKQTRSYRLIPFHCAAKGTAAVRITFKREHNLLKTHQIPLYSIGSSVECRVTNNTIPCGKSKRRIGSPLAVSSGALSGWSFRLCGRHHDVSIDCTAKM